MLVERAVCKPDLLILLSVLMSGLVECFLWEGTAGLQILSFVSSERKKLWQSKYLSSALSSRGKSYVQGIKLKLSSWLLAGH